ncbi:unnamed protein product [Rotaria sp. Silwood2]|nr:unnamed protein product [Rotaria sp. Silwood2]CAF3294846.1 unnamed protein product [Rotaria sp. Silwood2]CAF3447536.1 unnamed protein product [Rotaria sp. Silwood2]CAF4536401.1 unnamed protein product [Rotaria sp. Silwood2]CAF4574664.1 unnamed protein product [Rotaria sp. Silwood2]
MNSIFNCMERCTINQVNNHLNPNVLDPSIDHTVRNSSGHYYYCDPTGASGSVYMVRRATNVLPNTKYEFSAWFCSMLRDFAVEWPATVQLSVNGVVISKQLILRYSPHKWILLNGAWNSGSNTNVIMSIDTIDPIVSGHDFAIDDISFVEKI